MMKILNGILMVGGMTAIVALSPVSAMAQSNNTENPGYRGLFLGDDRARSGVVQPLPSDQYIINQPPENVARPLPAQQPLVRPPINNQNTDYYQQQQNQATQNQQQIETLEQKRAETRARVSDQQAEAQQRLTQSGQNNGNAGAGYRPIEDNRAPAGSTPFEQRYTGPDRQRDLIRAYKQLREQDMQRMQQRYESNSAVMRSSRVTNSERLIDTNAGIQSQNY